MEEINYKEAYVFAIQRQEMIDYVNNKKKEKEGLDELKRVKGKE